MPGLIGSGACSANGTVSRPGFRPNRPTKWHGLRIEPPRSEPIPSGDMPDAIAAASPPDEPPAVRIGSCGFAVAPKSGFTESHQHENSETLVLPSRIAPAPRRRRTTSASSSQTWSASSFEPFGERMPATAIGSLTVNGTPWSDPRTSAASAATASSRAASSRGRTSALISGSRSAMRAACASKSSIGDSSRLRTARAIQAADRLTSSVIVRFWHRCRWSRSPATARSAS